jgi:ubiquinone/menaquinone biosynthesis C-methylase UbiE
MVDRGYTVTGIDISPEMIGAARRLVPEAELAVMDMARLRYPARRFDGIFAAYSFIHLPPERMAPALREFRRVLVPDGVIGFIVKRGQGELIAASPLVPGESCYVQLWDDNEFAAHLETHGFEILERSSAAPDSPEELPFERLFFLARVVKRAGHPRTWASPES